MSELRRVASHEIPDSSRWQISAAWDLEYNRIRQFLQNGANHNVGARIDQSPNERTAGAKRDGATLPDEVNAIYGAMPPEVNAEHYGEASRGELERRAPSKLSIKLLGIATLITFSSEVAIFFIMWLTGQFGSFVPVVVGLLLAFSGLAAGEGLGDLLIAHEEGDKRKHAMPWIFLIGGTLGIVGMTTIRYLAARSAAEEGEEIGGLIAMVLLTTLLAVVIAVFHAAHMVRKARREILVAQQFGAQLVFATKQAQRCYAERLWSKLHDQAVDAFVAGRAVPVAPATGAIDTGAVDTPPPMLQVPADPH